MRAVLILVVLLLLSACGLDKQSGNSASMEKNTPSEERIEGVIADMNGKQILVIPDATREDLVDATWEELYKKNGGAYYYVDAETADTLKIGMKVAVFWDGDQEDSEPPLRSTEKVEIISNEQ
ncbi:hypothetical protein FIU87_19840 [Bacillus sp. THAF10]|uniref:DUF3221 domain-containing protein n=1 Tax=Bacillus sp. THAF10 TaxID=2587848 RepID=UPI001268CEA2|nr:DUF3221 domain-containing protein [Bacillus sp. THAF10]QFT90902.1 hypothetical protein FIU87_19840 [Bacillus sp. THAF10]